MSFPHHELPPSFSQDPYGVIANNQTSYLLIGAGVFSPAPFANYPKYHITPAIRPVNTNTVKKSSELRRRFTVIIRSASMGIP